LARSELVRELVGRLREAEAAAAEQFASTEPIRHLVVDDLLPDELARRVGAAFPAHDDMKLLRSPREDKYVAAQMDRYDPLLSDALYCFQDREVIAWLGRVTGIEALEPDDNLYLGGISSMGSGQFLNPHIDQSHDRRYERWRVLNLLWYVTPDWDESWGGNLELWPDGPKGGQITIHSRFNRLVVMETHQRSWHSVSPITHGAARRCVSNYCFSVVKPARSRSRHVTSFRGRPEQRARDLVLRADNKLRGVVRRTTGERIFKTDHVFTKPGSGGDEHDDRVGHEEQPPA
jgi:Rps23 Pro-64 3,4-dihydroxylase Tpa1-like proline 4-hydroxylase